jgi:hypothetical protein
LISGTPTTAGVFSFTIKVVDSLGTVAYSACAGTCTTVDYNYMFTTPTGNLGSSEPYTQNGITLTAYAYKGTNTVASLYGQNSGTNVGLGIYGLTGNQIDANSYVQVDVSAALAAGAINGQVIIGGISGSDKYNVYGSNTLGSIGTLLLSNQTIDLTGVSIPNWGSYKYISVRAASGCGVLFAGISFDLPTKCVITIGSNAQYETYTPGGWGAPPNGNNVAQLLANNFKSVYGSAGVKVGGGYTLTFTSAYAIQVFLPNGGTPGVLNASATNPQTSTSAGEFASQVLALQLNVDFSNKGLIKPGLANLHVLSGPLAGLTVTQVLGLSNAILGGDTGMLPSGLSVADMTNILGIINGNYDNATQNNGYLF